MNSLGIGAAHTDLPKNDVKPIIEETSKSIKQIRNVKAAVPGSVLSEGLKSDVDVTAKMFDVNFRKY